eukprot:6444850-Prymnesium_polylepis.1
MALRRHAKGPRSVLFRFLTRVSHNNRASVRFVTFRHAPGYPWHPGTRVLVRPPDPQLPTASAAP